MKFGPKQKTLQEATETEMLIDTFYIRFYKSFNYDYLRKFNQNAVFQPWDYIEGMEFPFVRIPIEESVTAVVGANESGKSHLIKAMKIALRNEKVNHVDTCRFSPFYKVEEGKRKVPDFGFRFINVPKEVKDCIKEIKPKIKKMASVFYLFRIQNATRIYVQKVSTQNEFVEIDLDKNHAESIQKYLPVPREIYSKIGLPPSIPLVELIDVSDETSNRRLKLHETFVNADSKVISFFKDPDTLRNNAERVVDEINKEHEKTKDPKTDEVDLAKKLLFEVAKIDKSVIMDIFEARNDLNKVAHLSGLLGEINRRLAVTMNFPSWWVQDKKFNLIVDVLKDDLIFKIVDRTKTEYTFTERSHGLRYFLSYYVQYKSHKPLTDADEILLMDEPDAYLSSQAQQDLLKILNSFARPADESRKPIQVLYVTHSPFLIDKNHAERIRVLEKGISDEGTRVAKDAGKNRYEPLRSSVGAFVGETAFIGNTNLFVEGISDQILLAGLSHHLRSIKQTLDQEILEQELLDLNQLTIVPAGSASHIPYLVFLARAQDEDKPATVVLLDSDKAGNDARKGLAKGGNKKKMILRGDLVFQIGMLKEEKGINYHTESPIEIEDLIPISLCVEAVKVYLRTFCMIDDPIFTAEMVDDKLKEETSLIKAIQFAVSDNGEKLEKIGFARSLISIVNGIRKNSILDKDLSVDLKKLENNSKILFTKLNFLVRDAEREINKEQLSKKIKRINDGFFKENRTSSTREQASIMLEDIENSLDGSKESEKVQAKVLQIRNHFKLEADKHLIIENYEEFQKAMVELSYLLKIQSEESVL